MKAYNAEYQEVGLTTDVMSASAHRLVQLLFDKCSQHIETAKICITSNDYLRKSQSLSKALDIVEYLRLCLNHQEDRAKALSEQLDGLYIYIQKNLLQANLNNDLTSLNEASKTLKNIKDGWDGIA